MKGKSRVQNHVVDYTGARVRVGDYVDLNRLGICQVRSLKRYPRILVRRYDNNRQVTVEPYQIALGNKVPQPRG